MMITNLTVWTDLDSLHAFAYRTVHRYFLQSRRRWFGRMPGRQLVMWWLPAGQVPTLAEALQKLRLLEERGPTAEAFTFQKAFDPAGRPLPRAPGERHEQRDVHCARAQPRSRSRRATAPRSGATRPRSG
jgi:hypothetical protein